MLGNEYLYETVTFETIYSKCFVRFCVLASSVNSYRAPIYAKNYREYKYYLYIFWIPQKYFFKIIKILD